MPLGRRVGADDLSRLDELLEPAELVGELRRLVASGHLAVEDAEIAARRILDELDRDLRAAAAGRFAVDRRVVEIPRLLDLGLRLVDRYGLADALAALRLALLLG